MKTFILFFAVLFSSLYIRSGWSTDVDLKNPWDLIASSCSLHPRLQLSHTCKKLHAEIKFDFDFSEPKFEFYFPALLKMPDLKNNFLDTPEITLSFLQSLNSTDLWNLPQIHELRYRSRRNNFKLFCSLSKRRALRSCKVSFDVSPEWPNKPGVFFEYMKKNPIVSLSLYTGYNCTDNDDPMEQSADISKPLIAYLEKMTTLKRLELYGTSFQ